MRDVAPGIDVPDQFRCELSYRTGWWVSACGELDLAARPQLDLVADIIASGSDDVIVDLRGITFMDSVGLGFLVRLLRHAERMEVDLAIVRGSEAVERIIAIAGLQPLLASIDAPSRTSAMPPEHAVIATDLSGEVVLWNRAAEGLYGWRSDEVLGHPITELTVGPCEQELAQEIMDSVRRCGRWEGEFNVRRSDGTTFRAHVRNELFGSRGTPEGLVGRSIGSAVLLAAS
jgi:anti-anti-sigma factor